MSYPPGSISKELLLRKIYAVACTKNTLVFEVANKTTTGGHSSGRGSSDRGSSRGSGESSPLSAQQQHAPSAPSFSRSSTHTKKGSSMVIVGDEEMFVHHVEIAVYTGDAAHIHHNLTTAIENFRGAKVCISMYVL